MPRLTNEMDGIRNHENLEEYHESEADPTEARTDSSSSEGSLPNDIIADLAMRKFDRGHYSDKEFPGLLGASPMVLWALLQTNGSRKLSVDQYSSVRHLMKAVSEIPSDLGNDISRPVALPHYRTLSRSIRPLVLNMLSVKDQLLRLPVDLTRTGARADRLISNSSPLSCVPFVPPSEYAKADLQNRFFFYFLQYPDRVPQGTDRFDVRFTSEDSALVRYREKFYGEPCWFEDDGQGSDTPT